MNGLENTTQEVKDFAEAQSEIERLRAANALLKSEVRAMRERLAHAHAHEQNLEEQLRQSRARI